MYRNSNSNCCERFLQKAAVGQLHCQLRHQVYRALQRIEDEPTSLCIGTTKKLAVVDTQFELKCSSLDIATDNFFERGFRGWQYDRNKRPLLKICFQLSC